MRGRVRFNRFSRGSRLFRLLGLPPKLILPIEPHFVRKGSPETRNRNFTSVFGDRTSFRAKGLRREPGNRNLTSVFPQQCKLTGSSAQNSSGVDWCRRRVRFNDVPEKVPKVPEKGMGGFGAEPGQVQQGSECRARSGSTGFRRRFR